MAANLNNRISSVDQLSPKLLAEINDSIRAAVREVLDQYREALHDHPEEILAAHAKYFGTSL